jgi:AAA15 family ATPase/GTPase
MLTLIRIANYAIIDEVEVELEPGFSVMTGETGAGKSILVDAFGTAPNAPRSASYSRFPKIIRRLSGSPSASSTKASRARCAG